VSRNYESELTASRADVVATLSGVVDGDEASLEVELEWALPGDDSDDDTSVEAPETAPPDEERPEAGAVDPTDSSTLDGTPSAQVGAADTLQSFARVEVYRDRGGEWRWRLRHRNGNVIAVGGEGYTRKHNARNAPGAETTDVGDGKD